MNTRTSVIVVMLAALVCGATACAAPVNLAPSDFANISASQECAESGFAVLFDLSSIPTGATIDLAELQLTINTDTSLGSKTFVGAILATSEWDSEQIQSLTDIDVSDSLAVGCQVSTGQGAEVEINITPLANLWHSGEVANRGLVVTVYGVNGAGLNVTESSGVIQANLKVSYTRAD